jgi:hypothetical protein
MNLSVEQYNNLESNFGSKSVLLLMACMQSIYAIIKMVSEKTCFLGLLKNCENVVATLL